MDDRQGKLCHLPFFLRGKCRKTAAGSTARRQLFAMTSPQTLYLADHVLAQVAALPPTTPILIAGPTASGKSSFALKIAEAAGGVIVNADALQVFEGWRIVTARPDDQDLARAAHALYGHVPFDQPYSVGDWLRDVGPYLHAPARPIIVGGTGLYHSSLTQGLAKIPEIPDEIRAAGDALSLAELIAQTDAETLSQIDQHNRARVQRAWEVRAATGRALRDWQKEKSPPLLAPDACFRICLHAPPQWLTPRIELRFQHMLEAGALDEAEQMRSSWDPTHQSSKAIGAAELISVLNGDLTRDEAAERVTIATRQYAKRQRTWFRGRMADWTWMDMTA